MNTPNNIDEVLIHLDQHVTEKDKKLIRSITEEDMWDYHHTVGRAMRNDWGLWDRNSNLHQWFFKTLNIWHADDMSGIIMTSYWRHLNGVALDLENQTDRYHKHWKEMNTTPYNE